MIVSSADRLNDVGEYYFSRKQREISRLEAAGHDVINLGIGSPDLSPSAAAVKAIQASVESEDCHGYQPYNGTKMLRSAMANWYRRTYSVELDYDSEILPLLGSKEGIFHISLAFLNPGDKVLVPNPGYPAYGKVANLTGAVPLVYDLKEELDWLPDLSVLEKEDLTRVKVMWVNYPNMPTGAVATLGFYEELVEFAQKHRILICHDNPYSLVLNSAAPQSILSVEGAFDCCIELNSLSKSHHMAGWRVGMVSGKQDYLEAILSVKSNMDSGMFYPIQCAAVRSLENSPEWHDEQNEIYRGRRRAACELFDCLHGTYERARPGLFVWAKAPESIDNISNYMDDILNKAYVCLTPGEIFGSNGARYMRASLCLPEDRIREAVKRLQQLSL